LVKRGDIIKDGLTRRGRSLWLRLGNRKGRMLLVLLLLGRQRTSSILSRCIRSVHPVFTLANQRTVRRRWRLRYTSD